MKKSVWKTHWYLSVHAVHFPKHSSLDTLFSKNSFGRIFFLSYFT